MEERLAHALALVPGCAPSTVSPISGGITNRSYRVEVAGEPCMLRLAGNSTARLGIDRENELVAVRAMARAGVGADVVFADTGAGVLVTRWLPGRVLEPRDIDVPATRNRVAQLVRRVHDGPSFAGVFSPFEVVRDYRAKATALGTVVDDAERALEIMAAVEQRLRSPEPLRPCHNDLLAGNLLIDGDDLHIIDWEYAAMGDPLFDVANFVTNLELGEEASLHFFDAYLERPSTEAERAHLTLLCFMSDMREAFWGVLQSAQPELDFDFRGYGMRHLSRALAFTERARFTEALGGLKNEAER